MFVNTSQSVYKKRGNWSRNAKPLQFIYCRNKQKLRKNSCFTTCNCTTTENFEIVHFEEWNRRHESSQNLSQKRVFSLPAQHHQKTMAADVIQARRNDHQFGPKW